MNGAGGRRLVGFSSAEMTLKVLRPSCSSRLRASWAERSATLPSALAVRRPVSASKSLPLAMGLPSNELSLALKEPSSALKVPVRSQYSAETKRMRSRSRSTTIRVATLCTRPAESLGLTFRQRIGETS